MTIVKSLREVTEPSTMLFQENGISDKQTGMEYSGEVWQPLFQMINGHYTQDQSGLWGLNSGRKL